MSRSLFAKRARTSTWRSRRSIAGLIQAPSALSPWWQLGRGPRSAATSCSRACARRATSRRARGAGGAARAHAHHRAARGWPTRAPATRRSTCGSSSATAWARQPARLAGAHDVRARGAARGGAGGRGRAARPWACPGCRPRWSRSIPRPATCWPWSAGATSARRRSTARCAAGASRAPPSSPSSTRPRSSAASRPVSVLTDLHAVTVPRASRSGRRATQAKTAPDDADAARGAARVEQPGRGRAAAARRHRRRAERGRGRRASTTCPTCPRWPSAPGLVTPLELTAAYAAFPNGGYAVKPRAIVARARTRDGDVAFDVRGAAASARALRGGRVPDAHACCATSWTSAPRSPARSHGPARPGRRQDGHDRRLQGRLVRGLLLLAWWRACGSGFDQPAPDRTRGLRRARGPAHLGRLHAPGVARGAGPRTSSSRRRACGRWSCAASRTCGRWTGCPTYVEYFKEGDDVPRRLCPLHEGSLKQEARRVLDELLGAVGRRAPAHLQALSEARWKRRRAGRRRSSAERCSACVRHRSVLD